VLTPMYFMLGAIGRQNPPAITHPEFYFGFLGVTLVWQFAFFAIATDPARFRPLILISVFEKLIYVVTVGILYQQSQITFAQGLSAVPDSLLAILFVIAFFRTRSAHDGK